MFNALLKMDISFVGFDNKPVELKAGTEIYVDHETQIATAFGFNFDVDPEEYNVFN